MLLFDESLNHELQKKQMDFHETRYYNSEFLVHASAENMLEKFHSCKENLSFGNLIQLSMDGPNVNWKFYKMVEDELKNDYSCNLLNTGSLGIHIVHGAFKMAVKKLDGLYRKPCQVFIGYLKTVQLEGKIT